MAKNHLKRLAMPTTWTTKHKKGVAWVARGNPGMHPMREAMPLALVLRELLKYANTMREVKHIISNKIILIDGVRRNDRSFSVGLMDVLSIPDLKENYRISFGENGRLVLIKINDKEAKEKICKIKGKGLHNGKTQLRLSDGRTMLVENKDYKTSDSVVITVPEQKMISHLKFEKGASVLLTDGKKIGSIGTVEDIKDHTVTVKTEKGKFETPKKYCFIIGKNKPALTIA